MGVYMWVLTILVMIIARKDLFSMHLGDYSYSFQGFKRPFSN